MAKYICAACNFRFESASPKECPYCGRTELEKEKTADELLDEVEKLLEE